jgi:hypothetical protein
VMVKSGVSEIGVDHPEPALGQALLMEAIGTAEPDFLDGLLGQLANAGTKGRVVDEHGLNFIRIRWKRCSRLRWRRSTTRL